MASACSGMQVVDRAGVLASATLCARALDAHVDMLQGGVISIARGIHGTVRPWLVQACVVRAVAITARHRSRKHLREPLLRQSHL